ncbi:MAG: hypothetical protein JO154_20935 [Chitinophaga sp.]|uniref:PA14 domain-containing protein n=1 Tax=Chitinophaga sp. TaxID=1869181 RepID=UPI0025BA10A2|nr:PA14 domain-containing protein [Chitinophaga sp.]MBV8255080.1 hypothetical protein [Chitinophaga sp.]
MILRNKRVKKPLAIFFLSLWASELLLPLQSLALTSGPKQPETMQFQPAGTTDMVNLFSGAFKYNIPLLDIDGYPVNLNYASGAGMDDEASWVGLGWNLSVGAINRQLRGVPDDMSGDNILTEHSTEDNLTYGVTGTVRGELFGSNLAKLSGSINVGIFSNNYTGMGAEVGANAGLKLGLVTSGYLTAGLNAGINSNTSSGVSVDAGMSLSSQLTRYDKGNVSVGLSANLGYNTREGLKALTLGANFSAITWPFSVGHVYMFNTPPFNPKINIPYKNTSRSYSLDLGFSGFGAFTGAGLTGYMTRQSVASKSRNTPSYGALYADKGSNNVNAVMDFMREKDNPAIPNLPNLPVSTLTPDVFTYDHQAGSGQFRLRRGGAAVIFDNGTKDLSDNFTAGGDFGVGGYFHGGVTLYNQSIVNKSGKWSSENSYLRIGDYKNDITNPAEEQAYFKPDGDLIAEDGQYDNMIYGEDIVDVPLSGKSTLKQLKNIKNDAVTTVPLKKNGRQPRTTVISYLTNAQASKLKGKRIFSYPLLNDNFNAPSCSAVGGQEVPRLGGYRKANHISMFTITETDGKRAEYGIPVYNIAHDEFTVAADPSLRTAEGDKNGLTGLRLDPNNSENLAPYSASKDKFYHHEQQPAYASSYLLTALYSPDYVDVTNDGISDDDPGTAIKFNYSRATANYRWRTPMAVGMGSLNKGLNADPEDDRVSVVTGAKELWYIHSIETKTKIAYFLTDDREDALGVKNLNGELDLNNRQRRLKKIVLYSKSDLTKPIKTVVLNYDPNYALCGGVPNNANGHGKLTLAEVYFQYGTSDKGKYNRYTFDYENAAFSYMSTDRWGGYKPQNFNALGGFGEMKNDEFPYVIQHESTATGYPAQWNLIFISLPSGGRVSVNYESGDYAYVQDRKAMQMVKPTGLITDINATTTTNSLQIARGFVLPAPGPLRGSSDEEKVRNFVNDYLGGRNDFYARLKVNMTDTPDATDDSNYDIVPAYGEVEAVKDNGNGTFNVIFKNVTEGGVSTNPFQMAAWQKMRLDYPMYAYPGYKNRIRNDMPIEAALNALVNAIGNLSEIRQNFNKRAARKMFASKVNLERSFVRLVKADGRKYGGPSRVRSIELTDLWSVMGGTPASDAYYGQTYEYTLHENGKEISSGVASYEPYIGGDENPMRMPVPYSQISRGTLNNNFYLEEPFGESLFPAPSVGYRSVRVRDMVNGGVDPNKLTGWVQHEFYTAKDFPVIVKSQPRPEVFQNGPYGTTSFTGGREIYQLSMSQGYVVMTNDMHGKPKAERVFNRSGAEISSTAYFYKSDPLDAGRMKLNNAVTTVDENGVLHQNEVIGRQIELVTDMREAENTNTGTSIQIGVDVIPIWGFSVPIPHWPKRNNDSYKLFRSASTLKLIEQTGILDHVVKTVNGSSAVTNNLVFDRNTGGPVVTSTTNEFNDPVYSVTMPAYWKYTGMSGAYKNIGSEFPPIATNSTGYIVSGYINLFTQGDELMDLATGQRLWVIKTAANGTGTKYLRLINDAGTVVPNYAGMVKVIRSGYRNLLGAPAESVVCLKNPLGGNRINVLSEGDMSAYKVLSASAVLYEEEWSARRDCNCPTGYVSAPDGNTCYKLADKNPNPLLNLIRGLQHPLYGTDGVVIDSSGMTTKSNFWGGSCGIVTFMSANTMRMAGDTPLMAKKAANAGVYSQNTTTDTYCGRLNTCGIWFNEAPDYPYTNRWIVLETCLKVDQSGNYTLGYGVDNAAKIYIDGNQVVNADANDCCTYLKWHLNRVYLTAGTHRLRIEGMNTGYNAVLGVEVYRGTPEPLITTGIEGGGVDIVFSTKDLLGSGTFYTAELLNADRTSFMRLYNCNTIDVCRGIPTCDSVTGNPPINPFIKNILGNWRPSEEKTYLVNRNDNGVVDNRQDGAMVRSGGTFTSFKPYWYFSASLGGWVNDTNSNKWITSRYITSFNQNGEEEENKDALLRYSAALFGYQHLLSVAVGANAMKRELYFDGFEDYKYRRDCYENHACFQDPFNMETALPNLFYNLETADAHSGNYSLKLTEPITLKMIAHNLEHKPGYGQYTDVDANGEYIQKQDKRIYPVGFQPVPGKRYIFSAWVKDKSAGNIKPSLSIKVDDKALDYQLKATVEKWKQIEGEFVVSGTGTFQLFIPSAAGTLIDDIRIYPYNGSMQTHAYDEKTLRLMATMDENNFATFYEYDDEGTLIRVKKETDRGIMTLKETRSGLWKNPFQ